MSHTTIIAEAGVNHNGDLDLALRLVEVAAKAGADVVKFQTFKAEALVSRQAPKAEYQKQTTGTAESQFDMLKRLELAEGHHHRLMNRCQELGIEFMSTPFDESSADMLAALGVSRFKLPSGEITNLPFLAHVARLGKPVILSTGMADLTEVADAVRCIRASGNPPLTLLHCVTNYPADPADSNLRAMATMATAFDVPVGWSDHTAGITVSLAAVALGAVMVEKHFTLDRSMDGPDHRASLEPADLEELVRATRMVEVALGHGRKEPAASESGIRDVARKSLVAAVDLPAGHVLSAVDLDRKRPGSGLSPARLESVLGRTLVTPLSKGSVLHESMLK